MSNQVYESSLGKYYAARGINFYNIATDYTITTSTTASVVNISGYIQDAPSLMSLAVDGTLTCQADGVYAISTRYEFENMVVANATNVGLNITVNAGAYDLPLATRSIFYPAGTTTTSESARKFETLSLVIFLKKSDTIKCTITNNTTDDEIRIYATGTYTTIQKVY